MRRNERLAALAPEERVRFCREVVERLSELVEGEAPEELAARVQEIFGDCTCYEAYRATLGTTIELAHESGQDEPGAEWMDDEAFAACVERVRDKLGER